jgi:hypothetical protein
MMAMPAAGPRGPHGESARRRAERAVAELHSAELLEITARIEAGEDAGEIVRAMRQSRRHPAAAAHELARLRAMVEERLARLAAGHDPWSGPLRMPREVDFGEVDMWLYVWAAILFGVVLSQNAVDGSTAAAGRAIPGRFSFADAADPEFWHGGGDDGSPLGSTGGWPWVISFTRVSSRTDAA